MSRGDASVSGAARADAPPEPRTTLDRRGRIPGSLHPRPVSGALRRVWGGVRGREPRLLERREEGAHLPGVRNASSRGGRVRAAGERRIGEILDPLRARGIAVLHDLQVPGSRANVDHIVIAPSGLHVIDTKRYKGKVEIRDKGNWLKKDLRLYVGGRDRTKLVGSVQRQCAVVHGVIEDLLRETTTLVTPVLCFVGTDWPLLSKRLSVDGVKITWPKELAKLVQRDGPLTADAIKELDARVASRMRPA